MSGDEVTQKRAKKQAEKAEKISKGIIIAEFARSVHPVQISAQASLKDNPIFPVDLRFVRYSNNQLRYVKHIGNGVLSIITIDDAASAFACALGNLCCDYGTKEFVEMARLARMSGEAYEKEAAQKIAELKENALADIEHLPLIINENEIVPVRELSDWGWCWKRLDFDADSFGDPGAWLDEVKPRIKTNWYSFCAFIGSLFYPNSNRERYVWIYGSGESGKSTICEAIIRVFGDAACARDAKKINEKWFVAGIQGKRLVVMGEAQAKTVNSGTFKCMTGDEYHECEQKGQPVFTVRLDAKFMIVSNDYPDIASGTENSRRIILVETEKPDGWEPNLDNTKEKTFERLNEGWPWFLAFCKEQYEKNPRLVPETMETVYDLQGEDENQEAFNKHFEVDKDGITTYPEIISCLGAEWPRWKVRKFVAHCIKIHRVTRDRTESLKFFRGMKKKGAF